MIMNSK